MYVRATSLNYVLQTSELIDDDYVAECASRARQGQHMTAHPPFSVAELRRERVVILQVHA